MSKSNYVKYAEVKQQKCTGSKSFSILQTEVDGHTKYLPGIDLPIMINSIFENETLISSEVSGINAYWNDKWKPNVNNHT